MYPFSGKLSGANGEVPDVDRSIANPFDVILYVDISLSLKPRPWALQIQWEEQQAHWAP